MRSRVQKFPAWPTFQGDRNKTNLLFFNIVSLFFNTLFNWYINLTIDGTIYPSQHFPIGAAFVRSRVQKFPGLTYKNLAKWKMLWGIYSAIYGEVNVSVEKCVEIKGVYVEK